MRLRNILAVLSLICGTVVSHAQSTGFLEIKPKETMLDESLNGAAKFTITATAADLSITISHQNQGINHFKGVKKDEFGRYTYEYILDTKNSSGQNIASRDIQICLPNDPNITSINLRLKKNTVFPYYATIYDEALSCNESKDFNAATHGNYINGKSYFVFRSSVDLIADAIAEVPFEIKKETPKEVDDNKYHTTIIFDCTSLTDIDKLKAEYDQLREIAPALQTDEQADREMELEKLLGELSEKSSPVITLRTEGSITLEVNVLLENKKTRYYVVQLQSSMTDYDRGEDAFANRKFTEANAYFNAAASTATTEAQKELAQEGARNALKCLQYLKEIRQRELLVKKFINGKVELESAMIEQCYKEIIQHYQELLELTGNVYYAERKAARENSLRRMPMAVNGYCTVLKGGMTQQTGDVTVYGIPRDVLHTTKLPNHGVPKGAVELFHVSPDGRFSSQIRHGDYIYLLFVPDQGNKLTTQNGALDLREFETPRRHASDVNVRMGNIKEGTTVH